MIVQFNGLKVLKIQLKYQLQNYKKKNLNPFKLRKIETSLQTKCALKNFQRTFGLLH